VVSFGNRPTPVRDEIIQIIRSRIEDGYVRMEDELKRGDEIIVSEGPFGGFTGIFEREMQDVERVEVLLNAVNYQAHLILDKQLVKKASR
jgi:transcriptional antiterminator RfaH